MPDLPGATPSSSSGLWRWFALVLVIILLDQITKQWAEATISHGDRLNLLPVFDLTLVYNKGAAWSFLSNAGGWQRWLFTAISAVVSVFIVFWMRQLAPTEKRLLLALSFILGGAVGNLIDRALFGHVIDFLLVYYQTHHFPVFNIADSAITVGAAIMILDMFLQDGDPAKTGDAELCNESDKESGK